MGGSPLVGGRQRHRARFRNQAFAAANDYVVLTHDLDFSAILATTHGEKPSVVQRRAEDLSPKVIGPQLTAALRYSTPDLEAGALVTVDTKSHARAPTAAEIQGDIVIRAQLRRRAQTRQHIVLLFAAPVLRCI